MSEVNWIWAWAQFAAAMTFSWCSVAFPINSAPTSPKSSFCSWTTFLSRPSSPEVAIVWRTSWSSDKFSAVTNCISPPLQTTPEEFCNRNVWYITWWNSLWTARHAACFGIKLKTVLVYSTAVKFGFNRSHFVATRSYLWSMDSIYRLFQNIFTYFHIFLDSTAGTVEYF